MAVELSPYCWIKLENGHVVLGRKQSLPDVGKYLVYMVRVDNIPPGQTTARIVFRAK